MATTKLTDKTPVTTLAGTDKVVVATSSGIAPMTLTNFRKALTEGMGLDAVSAGVMIYTAGTDGRLRLIRPHKWSLYSTSGYTPIGIVVESGEKRLVVALDEASLGWGTAQVSGGGVTTSDRGAALADWAGKANTTAQIAHAECSGTNTAPGYCHAYSKVNANNYGLGGGKWWLPSLGELLMIYANMEKINYALSLIDGATALSDTGYLSSTEKDATCIWNIGFSTGIIGSPDKATASQRVRPVSALQ